MTEPFDQRVLNAAIAPVGSARFGAPEALDPVLAVMRARFGDDPVDPPEGIDISLIINRLRAGDFLSSRELCWCCASAGIAVDVRGIRIMESESDVAELLRRIDTLGSAATSLRYQKKAYRALVHSYFTWAPEDRELKKTPWQIVRSWLQLRLDEVRTPQNELWDRIVVHRDVFSDNPGRAYTHLDATAPEINQLRKDFGIPHNSWFIEELFRAKVISACDLPYEEFEPLIPSLIGDLDVFPQQADWVLVKLLERYRTIGPYRTANTHLQELSITLWQSPRDEANYPAWRRVSTETRDMVARWLTARIIKEVFHQFAIATPNDGDTSERSRFWEQWEGAIDDLYLFVDRRSTGAFGAATALLGRDNWGTINDGGPNNAFLMVMGNYAFMEFSHKPNAMYPYHRGKLPFSLGRKSYRSGDLKDTGMTIDSLGTQGQLIKTWVHTSGSWTTLFAERLHRLGLRRS